MRGHHKHAVWLYNQFKDGKPTDNMLKCWSMQCDSIFCVWTVSHHSKFTASWWCTQQVRCHGSACTWCKAFASGIIDVNEQRHRCTSMSTMDDNVCHADVLIREDRHIKQTTQDLDILLCRVHSSFHNQLDHRTSMCMLNCTKPHRWLQITLYGTLMDLPPYAEQGEQFCSALLQWFKYRLTAWHGYIHYLLAGRKFKAASSIKKIMATACWYYKGVSGALSWLQQHCNCWVLLWYTSEAIAGHSLQKACVAVPRNHHFAW
jgi:hypothetical protein